VKLTLPNIDSKYVHGTSCSNDAPPESTTLINAGFTEYVAYDTVRSRRMAEGRSVIDLVNGLEAHRS
jgi:hypothetical protein